MRKIKRRTALIVIMAILAVCMCGCSSENEAEEKETVKENTNPQIGMSFDSFVTERWIRDQDAFVSTARELGADVNVQSANGEVEEQISQIEYFIDKKMDAIVIVASDAGKLSEVIAKAKKADIPVICYDRLCLSSNADLYISFDNNTVGRLMGEALLKKIGNDAKIVTVCGPDADFNVKLVAEGFEEAISTKNAQIIESCSCEGWRSEEAYNYVSSNIETIGTADAIMCGNDDLAGAVIRVLSENRLSGKISVVGQDCDLAACQRIVEGTQLMTVYKPVEKLAKAAAEYAVKLAKDEPLDITETFSDGTYDVPCVLLDPIAVTKDNMDEVVIGSGFHLKEEVYLNSEK